MRALVIDDSRAMRMMVKNILKQLSVESLEAANGLEGLERLKNYAELDFVLVDWHMPEMDGCDFVRAMRSQPEFGSVPVLMVTSEGDADKVAEALDAGANEYIIKPFTKDAIAQKLNMIGVQIAA